MNDEKESTYANERVEKIIEVIRKIAAGEPATCELSEKNDIFDALGIGINMMADDIRASLENEKKLKLEAQEKAEELKQFNDAAVGRELKLIELEKEINQLLAELGRPPRYK